MKAKYIVMLIVCAIVTLSFTVVSSHSKEKAKGSVSTSASASFVGGIASEDPIK